MQPTNTVLQPTNPDAKPTRKIFSFVYTKLFFSLDGDLLLLTSTLLIPQHIKYASTLLYRQWAKILRLFQLEGHDAALSDV